MNNDPGLLRWLSKMTFCVMVIWVTVVLGIITLTGCDTFGFTPESNGWTYVTTLPSSDKVYMKRFPDRKVTIYYTARSIAVVKDE